jgi:hypothetical protein
MLDSVETEEGGFQCTGRARKSTDMTEKKFWTQKGMELDNRTGIIDNKTSTEFKERWMQYWEK